jgi:hypothetical protein
MLKPIACPARIFSLLLLFSVAVSLPALAAAKKLITAKPGNCAACHGVTKVLPEGHPSTLKLTLADCRACHEKSGPTSLRTKMPLFHLHQLTGVTCIKCHDNPATAEDVPATRCMSCHDTGKLADATAAIKPQNPHISKHYGKKGDCNLCHHQHTKSEDYCITCHSFNFVVP